MKFTSWFQREKYAYELALINAASKLLGWEDTTFPRSLCEMIILGGVILVPGCYTFTGLLYPSESLVRTAEDLFVEYAHEDRAYLDVRHKVRNGIPFDRKKPKIRFPIPAPPPPREDGSPGELTIADRLRLIDPENNTASLWLDEDGSICGFRCVWVQNMRGSSVFNAATLCIFIALPFNCRPIAFRSEIHGNERELVFAWRGRSAL